MANPENLIGKGFDVNPQNISGGRPKGSRNRQTIVREALEAIMVGTDQQYVDAMTAAIIAKAMQGDVQAYKELLDSGYGKVTDKTEHTGKDGAPLYQDVTVKVIKKSDDGSTLGMPKDSETLGDQGLTADR